MPKSVLLRTMAGKGVEGAQSQGSLVAIFSSRDFMGRESVQQTQSQQQLPDSNSSISSPVKTQAAAKFPTLVFPHLACLTCRGSGHVAGDCLAAAFRPICVPFLPFLPPTFLLMPPFQKISKTRRATHKGYICPNATPRWSVSRAG